MIPNHICKYSGCTLGADGGRKHYYACSFCDATENWKSMACCKEHYNLYIEEVLAARKKITEDDKLPERTDMPKSKVRALKKKSAKEAEKITREELKDYAEEIDEIGIPAVVEKINVQLDKELNDSLIDILETEN